MRTPKQRTRNECARVLVAVWHRLPTNLLVLLVAIWALGTGGFEIAVALRMRQEKLSIGKSALWVGLCGVLSGLFGLTLVSIAWNKGYLMPLFFGIYAFNFGILLIALFGELRRLGSQLITQG